MQLPVFKYNLNRVLISQIFYLRRTTRTNERWQKKRREKYLKMGNNRDKVKRSARRVIRQLKQSKYLETGDTETVDYNNDIDITDFNDDLSYDAETIIYKEPIIKRRNPKRKGDSMQRFDTKRFMKNVDGSYNAQFIKQVPMHPRDRLARTTTNAQRNDDDIEFMKQVCIHTRDRLARATKNAQSDDYVKFIKQVTAHPRDRLRRKAKTLKHPRGRMREDRRN